LTQETLDVPDLGYTDGTERNHSVKPKLRPTRIVIFLSLFSSVLFAVLGSPVARAAPRETSRQEGACLAIGEAPVVKGNSALAKEAAIRQALNKGVEDYIIYLLGSQGTVRHFDRVTEDILPAVQQEIQNFHILAEQQLNDRYKVLLRLQVNEAAIEEKLRSFGIQLTETSPIQVLFLVSELREGHLSYWWKDPEEFRSLSPVELALHKLFQERGFSPINRSLRLPDLSPDGDLATPDLSGEAVLEWGNLFSSDVVISGQCTIEGAEQMALTLNAWDVSQGIQVCQEFISEILAADPDDADTFVSAIGEIIKQLAAGFCPCIKDAVASDRGKITPLTVTLAGIRMPKEFWQFSRFLKEEVLGVTSVIPSQIKKNSLSATVEFQGDRKRFINRVLNHSKQPFPLRLRPAGGGEIVFGID